MYVNISKSNFFFKSLENMDSNTYKSINRMNE